MAATPEKTFRAVHRGAPMTPRKARYVANLVRGLPVTAALDTLKFCPRRAAALYSKVVLSALANAQQDDAVDHNKLHVVDIRADDGRTLKRWTPRSRGQMYPLLLRYAHLSVTLAEREVEEKRQVKGRKDRSRRARVEASRAAAAKAAGSAPETVAEPSSEPESGSEEDA